MKPCVNGLELLKYTCNDWRTVIFKVLTRIFQLLAHAKKPVDTKIRPILDLVFCKRLYIMM